MNGTHLGGHRNSDPLSPWRALAAAVILQALRDAIERPDLCHGQPYFLCELEGCSLCARRFLKSKECLDLLSVLLGRPCSRKELKRVLSQPLYLPDNPRRYDAANLHTSPAARPYRLKLKDPV
jgi:hypothetical protein